MFKNTKNLETDAAPSRPRGEEEISNSSSDEEEENENDDIRNEKSTPDDDIPEYIKSNTNKKADGNTYVQSTNIHISHSSGFQIGHQYHIHPFARKKAAEEEDFKQDMKSEPPPPNIKKLFTNRDPAEQKHFISIKFDIGHNWRKVAEKLGLSEGTIKQLHDKYKSQGISEVFYRLLLKWRESQPRTLATIGILSEALWNSNEVPAVTTLAKLYC